MIFIINILILFSFVLSQQNIETRQYSFYKSKDLNEINLNDYIKNFNGNYIVRITDVNNITYEVNKEVIFDLCDLNFNISLPELINENVKKVLIPKKNKHSINIKKCKDLMIENNELIINSDNHVLLINDDKYKYLQCNIIIWITGMFAKNKDEGNIKNHGVLREWHDNNSLYIEYSFTNGKKNGIQKRWYDNGQQEIMYFYNNEKLEGLQQSWYPNGVIKSEMHYSLDKKNGIFKEWYKNGQLKYHKVYEDDILVSILESYDFKGKSN